MSAPTASATPVYTPVGTAGQAPKHAPRVVVVAWLAEYLVVYRDHRVGAEHGRGGVSGSDGVRLGTGQANDMRGRGLARQAGLVEIGGNHDRLKSGRPEQLDPPRRR